MEKVTSYNSFQSWLELNLDNNKSVHPFCRIPFEYFNEYIEQIHDRSHDEVKDLLRSLLRPFTTNIDMLVYESYSRDKDSMEKLEVINRIENNQEAWEGLTWILEFLPHKPYKAIQVLSDYIVSEPSIPDDRIFGIEQCASIISEKFIYFDQGIESLTKLKPVEFEQLIEALYRKMGYKTELTSPTRDGGKDIIASIERIDGSENVYVECKLYTTTKLTRESVGYLGYVMQDKKVNRAVIFCTGYVSKQLRELDNRINIWTYEEINVLLNTYLGSTWPENIDKIIKYRKF